MRFNLYAHLTCLHITCFVFASVALKNIKVQGGRSAYSIHYPLRQALRSSRLKPVAEQNVHPKPTVRPLFFIAPNDPWQHASTHRILRLSRWPPQHPRKPTPGIGEARLRSAQARMRKIPPCSTGVRLLDPVRSRSVASSGKRDRKSALPLALPLRYSKV